MVLIRRAKKSDKRQLLGLSREFHNSTRLNRRIVSAKLFQLLARDFKHYHKEKIAKYTNADEDNATFVAEENGKLIGFIYGRIEEAQKKKLKRIGYVADWFVLEGFRHKGIGRRLWAQLIIWFKLKKCDCIELKVYPDNEPSKKIYRKLGLIEKDIIMGKKL